MPSPQFCLLLLVICILQGTLGANILFFIGMGSHSHRSAIEPLAHKLVAEGHSVTFLSPMKPTIYNPKFIEFSPLQVTQFYESVISVFADQFFSNRLADKYYNEAPNPRLLGELEGTMCQLIFTSPEFKPWLATAKFDMVVFDHTGNKCAYGLAYKWRVPTVLSIAFGPWAHEEDQFGFPIETHWLPNYALTNVYTEDRTFWDKLYVTLYRLYSLYYTNWIVIPKTDQLVRQVLDLPDMPSIEELEKNTSLIFMNQHFSSDYPRSLPPHVVPIGGMSCQDSNGTLPKNLQDFIDGSGDDGFVLISFGTIVSMSRVPDWFVNSLFETVKKIRTRFLWKWDSNPPANLPENVLTAPWFPQQDLLASKSIRAFVTHGGQHSTHQGIYHGVPMIVVPVQFDQPFNAQAVQHHQSGLHVELSKMTEKFGPALNSILTDPKYQKNAKLMSKRFKDRPSSPVETAYYWTDYLLRHGDVSYLRPVENLKQSWWQRRLLDVWAFIFFSIFIFILLIVKLVQYCLRPASDKVKIKRN